MRANDRQPHEKREIEIVPHYIKHPEGSVLISFGDTKVICSASVEDRVPPFLRGKGQGWITAEYAMLPRATSQRNIRESSKGKVAGRTMEIQRLIGRALRSVVDLEKLGEKTIWVDCDVIQADGGTRTAAITGAFTAVGLAVEEMLKKEKIKENPLTGFLAAVSVGMTNEGKAILDLDYQEDSTADVDMNVVMKSGGRLVEVQGTGEEATFSRAELNQMLDMAETGINELFAAQKEVLGNFGESLAESERKEETTNAT
ncbi:ribonuclease PH [Alkalicoccus daliensis]|uniref:Ribonuclease PH n=1 Tax=Alkalicoccus daliensis TaxID=745820 RepID=A0A1H0CIC1_9BACI|nr:ribonuclease PH [Alkalicoccus daliensis]SDN57620.1 ribonuclease PH [Alkalicoccus daliensis]